ncbi:MAG: hypothetical protein RL030_700 [Pseudomonadota bacterium]|jgi:hypothetical protein
MTGSRILRIALLLLCLTASTAQSWVAQLHFHGTPIVAAGSSAHSLSAGENSAPGSPGHPEVQCLLCQVASQGAGVPLIAANPAAAAAPSAFIRLPASVEAPGDSDSRSHHWSSRGPPRA